MIWEFVLLYLGWLECGNYKRLTRACGRQLLPSLDDAGSRENLSHPTISP